MSRCRSCMVQLSEAELHREGWQPRSENSPPIQRKDLCRDEGAVHGGGDMATRRFWNGFLAGAGAAAASVIGWKMFGGTRNRRVLRVERSLQIGRGVDEVFLAWADLESLPQRVNFIESVERRGNRSHWVANLGGRRIEWDAEMTQDLPNEALGWK